jgi:hypothetical protein
MKCWKSRGKSYPSLGREQRAVYESPGSKELWLCLSPCGGFSFHSQSQFKQVIITTLIEYHIYEKTDRWRTVFSNIGPIEQSDNLGLVLMLAWTPVLILSSIVDRNPANSSSVEEHLNQLAGGVRTELLSNSDPKRRRRLVSVSFPSHSTSTQYGRKDSMVASSGSIVTN